MFILLMTIQNILQADNNTNGTNCCISVATIKFYTADSDKQLNTTNRTHYCVAMAALTIFIILQTVTYVAQQYK